MTQRFLPLLCLATTLSALLPSPSLLALEWNAARSGIRDFYDDANWLGGVAPGNPELEQVKFNMGGVSVTAQLLLPEGQTEQVLRGGLWFHITSVAPGTTVMDLQGHRLVLDGGVLQLSVSGGGSTAGSPTVFQNGTLQIGSSERAAAIQLGSNVTENNTARMAMTFQPGTTLDTFNTSSITVAAEEHGQSKNLLLDLSDATLRSGSRLQTLAVTEDIVIGAHYRRNPSNNRDVYGTMALGAVSLIEVQRDLIIGHRAWGNTSALASTSGTLEIAHNAAPITLSVGRDLRIGTGDRATGSIVTSPEQEWEVTVGAAATAPNDRGRIHVGYKDQVGSTNPPLGTSGSFVSGGGTFDAYVSELAVGKNALTQGTASGELDFSASEMGTLDVSGAAMIGQGEGSVGRLLLKGGSASSEDLIVGESTATERSLLQLDGTLWTVTGELRVGAKGDLFISGDLSAGGLDLLSSAPESLQITEGGVIDIAFNNAPTGSLLWGLRIIGDHQSMLQALVNGSGSLSASGLYGDQATVYYDGSYTYYGLVAIPEPSTLALVSGFGLALLFIRRIRR